MSASKPPSAMEQVIREFPPMGKYRIRVVLNERTKKCALDIREFVSSSGFEGFTRRGIRIMDRAQVDLLKDILKEIMDDPKLLL